MATPFLDGPDETHPLAVQKWLVAAAVMIGAVMTVLDASIINVSLPYMQKSFAADVNQITWVLTSYLVAVSVTIPMTGWFAVRDALDGLAVAAAANHPVAAAVPPQAWLLAYNDV